MHPHRQKGCASPCASPPSARCSVSRAALPAAATPRLCPWRTSTSTSPGICMPSPRPTTCSAPCIDNHIQQGNALGIDPRRILVKRCMDMNDRGPAQHRRRSGRQGQRRAPGGRLPDHGGQRGHGDPLPGRRPARSERAAGPISWWPTPMPASRCTARDLKAAGRDDRPAQGRHQAQPGADPGEHPGPDARRPVCQHRPRLQLGARHQAGPEAGRLLRSPRQASAPTWARKSFWTSSAAWPG